MPSSFCTPTALARSPSSDRSFGARSRVSWLAAWMVSTAGRASATADTAALNLLSDGSSLRSCPCGPSPRPASSGGPCCGSARRRRCASPRSAFCASKGIRSMTSAICSLGAATGGALRDEQGEDRRPGEASDDQRQEQRQQLGLGSGLSHGHPTRPEFNWPPGGSSGSPPSSSNSAPATPRRRGETRPPDTCRSESPWAAPPH